MTPALYAKLSAQVERQSAELADYESEIADRNIKSLNLQPAIDAAQAALDEAQATLQALQARPEDAPEDWQAPDTTAEQDAVNAAQKALDDAKAPQTAINSERDTLTSYATAIKASMAQCQKEMDASPVAPADVAAAVAAQEASAARIRAKQARAAAVDAITVTTQAGNTFDGDETSQTRMARAIVAMQAAGVPSVTWVLADNTVIDATVAELAEALALAGAAQAAIWVI